VHSFCLAIAVGECTTPSEQVDDGMVRIPGLRGNATEVLRLVQRGRKTPGCDLGVRMFLERSMSNITPQQLLKPERSSIDIDAEIKAEQARALGGNLLGLSLGYLAIAVAAAWMLRDSTSRTVVWGWFIVQVVLCGMSLRGAFIARKRPATLRNAPRRLGNSTLSALLAGLAWAAGVLLMWPSEQLSLQLFLVLMLIGLNAGALNSLSIYLPAFYAFFIPTALSVTVVTLRDGGTVNYLISATVTIYMLTSGRFVKGLNTTLVESIRRRYEMAQMAADLEMQKNLSEEANVAKSRFLAAASHDLRQPVHALSLFVGALGQQPLGTEAGRLLRHIQGSVDTLGDMFNALLDVSKLDAGMVHPEIRRVDLTGLLEKICTDERALAQAKGLSLRLNLPPQALAVRSDAALLNQILRNLVANAVRYTERGGVLVSARQYGDQVLIRVVDTGMGIPSERHEEIFQEFVQLNNPERDRAKGLGLGLAIVRRLTDLLKLQLSLNSQLGRGTCFTVHMPSMPATSEEAIAPLHADTLMQAAPQTMTQGGLVLVIDDDAEIRAGMQALLTGWGCEVVSAAGLGELMPMLAQLPTVPQLIISDYRLRGDETGLRVMEQLRSEYNDDIAGILISGDTSPERLREAKKSGLHLLHKPASPQALLEALHAAMGQAENAQAIHG
jgi:two-component system, sensor histidine kinase